MEYMILGGAIGMMVADTLKKEKTDLIARAKVCHSLQDYYTKERMTNHLYNYCLEYGPEEMMSHHSILLGQTATAKFDNPSNQKIQ